jgi:hypothetical protein
MRIAARRVRRQMMRCTELAHGSPHGQGLVAVHILKTIGPAYFSCVAKRIMKSHSQPRYFVSAVNVSAAHRYYLHLPHIYADQYCSGTVAYARKDYNLASETSRTDDFSWSLEF